jgi:hypothetical protein
MRGKGDVSISMSGTLKGRAKQLETDTSPFVDRTPICDFSELLKIVIPAGGNL